MGVNLLVNTALFAKPLDQRSLDKAVCPSGLAAKHSLKELFLLLRRFLEVEFLKPVVYFNRDTTWQNL